jgi:hypothetical protein
VLMSAIQTVIDRIGSGPRWGRGLASDWWEQYLHGKSGRGSTRGADHLIGAECRDRPDVSRAGPREPQRAAAQRGLPGDAGSASGRTAAGPRPDRSENARGLIKRPSVFDENEAFNRKSVSRAGRPFPEPSTSSAEERSMRGWGSLPCDRVGASFPEARSPEWRGLRAGTGVWRDSSALPPSSGELTQSVGGCRDQK